MRLGEQPRDQKPVSSGSLKRIYSLASALDPLGLPPMTIGLGAIDIGSAAPILCFGDLDQQTSRELSF
jgi:hypothetical protein